MSIVPANMDYGMSKGRLRVSKQPIEVMND